MAQKTRNKIASGKKTCSNCNKEKAYNQFYTATNPQASSGGGVVNICKTCVKKESIDSDGSLNVEKFKKMLSLMDKPYVEKCINSAIAESKTAFEEGKGRKDVIGNYFRIVGSLPQYQNVSFLQSLQMQDGGILASVTSALNNPKEKEEIYVRQVDDFTVTEDLLNLFGEGYTKTEYRLMNSKYDKLKINYTIQTNLHQEALATYVRFKVKEELATAAGNVSDAEKWNKAAQEAADKAKLTPKQLTQADLQGGINSFSEIFRAVEQAVDVVPILPRFKYRPNDAIDFIIWCYINYARDLQGLPQCKYEDVYKFYDKKKQEYISQYGDPYGIFDDDPSEDLRLNIKKFITLPSDYDEDGDEE